MTDGIGSTKFQSDEDGNVASSQAAAKRMDAALKHGRTTVFMSLLEDVIRTQGGFGLAARASGLNRTALYRIVSSTGNPALNTLVSLLAAVGLRLSIKPLKRAKARGNAIGETPDPESGAQ